MTVAWNFLRSVEMLSEQNTCEAQPVQPQTQTQSGFSATGGKTLSCRTTLGAYLPPQTKPMSNSNRENVASLAHDFTSMPLDDNALGDHSMHSSFTKTTSE